MIKTTDKPTLQEFHIEGVKHIAPQDAMELIEKHEAVLIDVREMNEVQIESIPLPNVLNHPLSVILDRLPKISKNQNIILDCPGGVRSSKVANLLNLQGYPSVANLDGGFSIWKANGLPFETHQQAESGCGCGCSTPTSGNKQGGCC